MPKKGHESFPKRESANPLSLRAGVYINHLKNIEHIIPMKNVRTWPRAFSSAFHSGNLIWRKQGALVFLMFFSEFLCSPRPKKVFSATLQKSMTDCFNVVYARHIPVSHRLSSQQHSTMSTGNTF